MSGLAGQAIGLDIQSPTPIGGSVAIDAESKGSMENFIGFGASAASYDPAPVDFDPADDTITSAADGTTKYAPTYVGNELTWSSGAPAVVQPVDQSIVTVNTSVSILTDPEGADVTADSAPVTNPWTPTVIDFNVALSAGGNANTIVVAEANKFANLDSWALTSLTRAAGYTDPFGGTGAFQFTANNSGGVPVNHSIDKSGSPAMTAPNGGFEIWAKGNESLPILRIYPLDGGAIHYGTVDLITGETAGNFSRIRIVERRDNGWVRIWFGTTQGATVQTLYLYLMKSMTDGASITDGTETVLLYLPRSADGELPFRQDQLCRWRRNGTSDGLELWTGLSPFLDSEADNSQPRVARVLLPDAYDDSKKYPVVYVGEVLPNGTVYGDPLATIKGLGLHNQYDIIFCDCDFKSMPWYGTKNDGTMMCDVHFSQGLVGMMDEFYSTDATPDGRLVLGFSKSGWGALSMLLLRPETFGFAAGWDVPWDIQFGDFETANAFGTEAQFQLYNPIDILPTTHQIISDQARFVLAGAAAFNAQTEAFYQTLEGYNIPFSYVYSLLPGGDADHRWDSGWLSGVVAELMSLIGRA